MDRPKRQRKIKKYDEDEFVEDVAMEAADMGATRRVYRLLRHKDIKSSLKDTVVHILWPENGTWYQAEVEQLRVREMRAHVRYPITNEEEDVDLQELILEKCLAVVEHLAPDTKLKRGREVPFSEEDAAGAEYETDNEPEEPPPPPPPQGTAKPKPRRQPAAGRDDDDDAGEAAHPGGSEDEDYIADQDSDGTPLSDDEKLDSDADVSDDQAPSDDDDQEELKAAGRRRSSSGAGGSATKPKKGQQAGGKPQQGKLNTPSRGSKPAARVSTGGAIGPVGGAALPPGMMPLDATGAGSTGLTLGGPGSANGAGLWASGSGGLEQQQGVLGKRRGNEEPGSEAKRRAGGGTDTGSDDGTEQPGAGSDIFKKSMLEKLLAKKAGAGGVAGAGSSGGGGGSGGGGVSAVRVSSRQLARGSSGMERRLSASGSAGSGLQRALSEVEVRQKAAGALLTGLRKAVEEAQAKHQQEQQQSAAADKEGQEQAGEQPSEAAAAAPAAAGNDKGAEPASAAAAAGAGGEQAAGGQQQQGMPPPPPQPQQQAEPGAGQGSVPELNLPDPQELADQIEQELFNLCGSLNSDYKAKMRSLAFNLRDPQNPDLRAHVLVGQISPPALVRMSAADLANKDLAEWRRKIEEEHNKAIELDVEAAAKFSTAAAWATREETLRKKEMALMGILATGPRKGTPEPDGRSPLHPGLAAAAAAAEGSQQDKDGAAAAAGSGQEGGAAAGGGAGSQQQGSDVAMADDEQAGNGTPTHPGADGGGGTPTRPASDDMEIEQLGGMVSPTAAAAAARGAGMDRNGSTGGTGAGGSNDTSQLQPQHSEQLSSLGMAGGAGAAGAEPSGVVASASLVLPAGSAAAASAGLLLQPLGSVTSKAPATAALAGIDWAAIKSEALRAVPKKSQAAEAAAAAAAAEAAAAAQGGTGGDDAPYDPDEDDDAQPADSGAAAAAGGGGSSGGGGSTAALQQQEGLGLDPHVPDMLPVVAAHKGPGPAPLQQVWHGTFSVPGAGAFAGAVRHLGGLGDVGLLLGPPGSTLEVIGRVALDKFAGFAEELRKSRSRTISLGLVGSGPGGGPGDEAHLQELLRSYSSKGRIGKLALAREVEGYLVARSDFTARLVKTATLVTPAHQQQLMPRDVSSSEFLLLLVHRKDYVPPPSNAIPLQQQQQQQVPPPPPAEQQQQQGPIPAEPPHLDPRRRAAMAAGAAAQPAPGQPGQPGVGLDLGSLSALAAALGLPGGPPPPAAGPDASAATAAGPGRAAAPPPWAGGTTLQMPQPDLQQQQQQQAMLVNPAGLAGPPPPPAGPGHGAGFSPAGGPSSGGGMASLQQQQQPGDGQQQQYTIDMRRPPPVAAPPGSDQMVFDLRQQQPGPPPPPSLLPPELGGGPLPLGPPAGSAGGAPVIILPPGTAMPAPGTPGIPDNAVFMTQDAATGALIPVGGGPLPPHLLAPGVMPPPFGGGPGGPPPPPPPPPHHHHHRPRGPGGAPPRPMVRTMQPRQGSRY